MVSQTAEGERAGLVEPAPHAGHGALLDAAPIDLEAVVADGAVVEPAPATVEPATAEPPTAEPATAEPPTVEPVAAEVGAPAAAGEIGPAQAAGVDEAGLDTLFRTARTAYKWRDVPVDDDALRRMYGLMKWGPTSGNSSPARFLFLRSAAAKTRLRPALSAGNVEKTLTAPVIAIVAFDPKFYEDLPRLYPGVDARGWFAGNDELARETAFRNGTLQGAYLMMAARAVGLDCGPMSGFDNGQVDREFFLAQGWKSNFLLALGYADHSGSGPRLPRLSFDEACRLL